MKRIFSLKCLALLLIANSCQNTDETVLTENSNLFPVDSKSANFNVNFQYKITIQVGGEAASEISAYDAKSQNLFIVNVESDQISVYNISDLNNPVEGNHIAINSGSPNSVSVYKGKVAVAVENYNKQANGVIEVYDANTSQMLASYQVGALPDMVTFSPNGKYIVSANEGEPNDDYTIDPKGSISVINTETSQVSTLYFDAYNNSQSILEDGGYRVFGPSATLAMDTEPEYVAISDNSNYAWVTLQENNGIAKVNLESVVIEAIYPLGFKDHRLAENALDASDKDDAKILANWPVYGVYMPDAIEYLKIGGEDYVITANEGDSRDYDGYSEEVRIKDLILDPTIFPDADYLQKNENIGRLKTTTTLGDIDNDGDYDELYSYGGRSFTIWTGNGQMVYDSGSSIAENTLSYTFDRFNDNDGRSDDKGAEPESVEVLKIQGDKYILFVGLERNDQVLVYDISNPANPEFLNILSHDGDEAPEGLLAISKKDSPNGKDLLIVSNEDSGTVTIYQNIQ